MIAATCCRTVPGDQVGGGLGAFPKLSWDGLPRGYPIAKGKVRKMGKS